MIFGLMRRSPLARLFHALEDPQFRLYSIGSAISLCGTWMQRLAIGWLAWQITESSAWLGIIVFADLLPTILFSPMAGAFADRWNRMALTRLTQVLAFFHSSTLVLLILGGWINVWWLLSLALVSGTIAAIDQPARTALVAALVGRDRIGGAIAVHSTIFAVARFIGPMLAGVTLLLTGPAGTFAVNAASHIVFLTILIRIPVISGDGRKSDRASLLTEMNDGIAYVRAHPGIAWMMLALAALGFAGRPAMELLPALVDSVFQGGPMVLASCTAAVGLGAIAGSLFPGKPTSESALRSLTIGGVAVVLGSTALFFSDSLILALPALACLGFGMSGSGIAIQTILQFVTAEAYRGRVLSIYGMVFRGTPAIATLGIGALAEWIGLQTALLAGALILLAAWVRLGLTYNWVLTSIDFSQSELGQKRTPAE